MFSKEQIENIRNQLIKQIQTTFPEDKKKEAIEKVKLMNEKQLENFLVQNNLIREKEFSEIPLENSSENSQNIFRKIIKKEVPFYKIEENKYALAILEINPISKGHIIIIPKEAVNSIEKIPQSVFSLAKKISKKIKSKLKPNEIGMAPLKIAGEFIINIFPIYENESINSERYSADEKELKEMQKKLEKKSRKKISKSKKKNKEDKEFEKIRLPKRIP